MRKILLTLIGLLLFHGYGICGSVDVSPIEYRISTGPHFDWWKSNSDDQGTQFYAPVTISTRSGAFSFDVLTAYAYTTLDLDAYPKESLTNLIDTKMNFSYEFVNKFPIDMLIGLDLNLPTGKTKIEAIERNRLLDPDLVTINNYGEGFNVNPTFILAKTLNKMSVGMGVGYVFRGEYDYSEEFRDYDPGDIFNVTTQVAYYFSDDWKVSLSGEYGYVSKDKINNRDYYHEGDFYLLDLELFHTASRWDATFNMTALFRGKSKFEDFNAALSTEDQNSYGDEYEATALYRYFLNDAVTLKTQLQGLWVTENNYSSSHPLYWGDRKKIMLGLGVNRKLMPGFDCELYLRGFVMKDDRNWYHPDDDVTYRGINSGILFSSYF
jgi:hypothetical protein